MNQCYFFSIIKFKFRFFCKNYLHSLIVKGETELQAKKIKIPDLRAGFAYILATLIAKDTSEITGLEYLDRGYENLDQKLIQIGANIKRIPSKHTIQNSLQKIIKKETIKLS